MQDVCQRRPCLVLWPTASYCRSEDITGVRLYKESQGRRQSSQEEIFGEGKIPKRYSPVKLGYTQTGYGRDSACLSLVPRLQPDLYLSALNAGVIKW
ncbi:hypothetical protein GE21DRAFT_7682 [Neurospora crassa]|uniref:Uncharacterized protein n=2 Tax=Neurospora crassa TaxID=5141 RepID=Q1K6R2_NEUCR|nr:hypothetical protein NCU01262 [Neurospora crassa OR74A]EAA31543.1 hypothetical protein NCU01262 [Neurospora crassa OR74A]KHE87827.1 hypothetical protein GE21DRAFT_7682 [Neurospora crassa]CAD70837.1 putative protein [Neurospora crassa]|eukprot:XP_960779.1 hypothetical protein NCU01262 [Neurospora crassa OR74A]